MLIAWSPDALSVPLRSGRKRGGDLHAVSIGAAPRIHRAPLSLEVAPAHEFGRGAQRGRWPVNDGIQVGTNDDDRLVKAVSSVPRSTMAWSRIAEIPPVTLRISRSPGTPAYLLGRPEGVWQEAIGTVSRHQTQARMRYEVVLPD
jgi:hypothetical protein